MILSTTSKRAAALAVRFSHSSSLTSTFHSGATAAHMSKPLSSLSLSLRSTLRVPRRTVAVRFVSSHDNNNNGTTTNSSSTTPTPTYVHPLSQIVLEHLQSSHHEFCLQQGLDQNLVLHPDGTFTLQVGMHDDDGDTNNNDPATPHLRIFTHYDRNEQKHWLTVHRDNLVGRFLLQDNRTPAWHSDAKSTPEKIQDAVDQMIAKLKE